MKRGLNKTIGARAAAYAGSLALLASCAPKSQAPSANAQVNFVMDKRILHGAHAMLMDPSGNQDNLPANLCYAFHITGSGITTVTPAQDFCGPAPGIGQFSPQAYNVGASASLTVLVGPARRFDLIGFASPLGTTNGVANCGALTVTTGPGPAGDTEATLFVGGTAVTSDPILFASGTGDVDAGAANNITLVAQPLVSSELTAYYAFGAPYLRKDVNGAAPAVCPAYVPATSPGVFAMSGVGAQSAVQSASGTATLKVISTAPVSTPSGGTSGTGSGGATNLETGLISVEAK